MSSFAAAQIDDDCNGGAVGICVAVGGRRRRRRQGFAVVPVFILMTTTALVMSASVVRRTAAFVVGGRWGPATAVRGGRGRRQVAWSHLSSGSNSRGGFGARGGEEIIATFATTTSSSGEEGQEENQAAATAAPKKRKPLKKKRWKVNPNYQNDFDPDALMAEFDKMAKAEGFDPSKRGDAGRTDVYYAEEGDEDDDEEDMDFSWLDGLGDDLDDDDFENEGDDDDGEYGGEDMDERTAAALERLQAASSAAATPQQRSMAERIAEAERDAATGRVTVPPELDEFARLVTSDDMKALGFRVENDPWGHDEGGHGVAGTSKQYGQAEDTTKYASLLTNALKCTGCGADFQSRDETIPGYLPKDKHEIQIKLAKIEEAQKVQEKADESSFEWSPEDEIEWLIRTADDDDGDDDESGESGAAKNKGGGAVSERDGATKEIDVDAMAEEMGLDLVELSRKQKKGGVVCKRCHNLQNYGEVDESLRPGWTEEPLLSQQTFRDLLLPLKEKTAVIVALVDLFDFSGSVLPELDAIAGDNPVILAANKADLLPSKMGPHRAENWVRRELEYLGVQSIANVGGAVRLVSCKTGYGVPGMLDKARALADEMDCDVYVVGAANAGKSTLINRILEQDEMKKKRRSGEGGGGTATIKKRAGNAASRKGAVTTSPLPGTTLKFISIELGDGRKLYDTPGLLVPGTLTQRLTPAELKMVVPKKQVEPVTFRVASGKCVLVGGLARIEVVGDSKPFLFTFFVANDIKLHVTGASKADEFIAKHAGGMLTPPLEPGPERMEQIGEFESHTVEIEGAGWKEAAADITLRGLGWVAVTGAGTAKVKISVPKGIGVSVRPPLMPFDIWEVAAKYTGGRAVRKGGRTKSGKTRKGVGRR